MKAVRIVVKGRVQGVFFRESTRQQALSLNLRGWVRNLRDGSVELTAAGASDDISALLGWLPKGPIMARVDDLVIEELPECEPYDDFTVRY